MMYYPQYLIEAYALGDINRKEFIAYLHERQKISGLDYTCKGTADKSGVYLTYRGITAQIKNNTLHFKTDTNDTASTPFEFRRKVDFYKEAKSKAMSRALATMNFYFDKAGESIRNSDSDSFRVNISKAKDWAIIAEERCHIWP